MKKKILLFVMMFLFVGVVKAYDIEEFFSTSFKSCTTNQTNIMVRDCISNDASEMTVSFTTNLEDNTISYETRETSVSSAVGASKALRYLVDNAPENLRNAYTQYKSVDKHPRYDMYNCQLETAGFCFEQSDNINKMTVRMDDTFIKFLITEYDGVIEGENPDDGQKDVVPGDDEYQQQQPTGEDSKNPDTGSFAEYGFIALLVGALLFVIHLKRRSEVEYKI